MDNAGSGTIARSAQHKLAIVGAGAVGSALAQELTRAGFSIVAVLSRTESSAKHLADQVNASGLTSPEELEDDVDTVFLCVPDDALTGVATRLATSRPSWRGVAVAHTSGMLDSGVLAPLASRGADVMSFHPVQSFVPAPRPAPPSSAPSSPHPGPSDQELSRAPSPGDEAEANPFNGITVTLEGAPAAVQRGTELAEALGARPLTISIPQKRAIHAAASIGSNFLVTLAAFAVDLGTRADIPREEMLNILRPLIAGTSQNLTVLDPESALTGPIVRGDADTVLLHLRLLHEYAPEFETLYRSLARATLALASRSGRISTEAAGRIVDLLNIDTIST